MSTTISDFLTPKQKAFCDEYLIDRNATAAALRAGYSNSIALNGYLMSIPKIKVYIKERCADAAEKAQVSHDMVLRELCKIAFGNLRNYFLPEGGLKPVHELTEDEAAALWSVSVTDTGSGVANGPTTKIRMYNKLTALDKIAKHLNFYSPEAKEPEKEYVYLNKEELQKHDLYGDEDEQAKQGEVIPDIPIGTDGNILCDKDGNLKFKVALNETYDENLARLEVYEAELKRPIKIVWVDAPDDADHRDLPLFKEMVLRLRKVGSGGGGYDNYELCFKFPFLRNLERMYATTPTFTQG